MDSVEFITIQYVSGTADVHSCGEETFTYLRIGEYEEAGR